jgi:hypothetical protein
MKKIGFLHSGAGDWVGMYIDGKLAAEGHELQVETVAKLLEPQAEIVNVYSEDEDLDRYGNSCPKHWPRKPI